MGNWDVFTLHDISPYLTAPSLTMKVYDYFGTPPNMRRPIQYNDDPIVNVPTWPIPEPSGVLLAGLAGLGLVRRRLP
jgi:MYXO-CTERM domain-containing protein